MRGHGFNNIPNDAIATMAFHGNNIDVYRHSESPDVLWVIVSKTDNEMLLRQMQSKTYNYGNFIGCIVSNDRETLYWLNHNPPF